MWNSDCLIKDIGDMVGHQIIKGLKQQMGDAGGCMGMIEGLGKDEQHVLTVMLHVKTWMNSKRRNYRQMIIWEAIALFRFESWKVYEHMTLERPQWPEGKQWERSGRWEGRIAGSWDGTPASPGISMWTHKGNPIPQGRWCLPCSFLRVTQIAQYDYL